MPAVEDGAIIEYSYELQVSTLTYMHNWTFQESVPTLLTRFTLNNPSQLDVNYRTYEIDLEPEINEAPEGFNSSYTWEARNMPAVESEVGMPPASDVVARLALAPIGVETWDDVASWYYDLITPRMQADQHLKSLAEELTADAGSDYEKMEALFAWVRDQVRYIAVSIGIGGYQPHHVDDIFRNQYGDCKDMVTLLVTMANEIGIEAYQALTSTFQNGVPDTTLPSPYHFNHVIAYAPNVGETGIWMDPTEKGSEFGQLPWYDQGTPVLKVGDDGEGTLIVTPTDDPRNNRKVIDWKVELEADGSATVAGSRKLWGANAAEFREDLMNASHTRQKRWLETDLAQLVSGAVLDTFSVSGLEPIANPLTIDFRFHTSTFAKVRNDQIVMEPGEYSGIGLPSLFASRDRTHPVRFSYGFQKDVSLEIHFPEEWQVSTEAMLDSVSSDFGKVEWNWYAGDQIFHANVSYLLDGGTIYPSRYSAFQEYLDKVRQRDLREIIFVKRQRADAVNQQDNSGTRLVQN
jgi:transglutaminase-like putative cysteine protease